MVVNSTNQLLDVIDEKNTLLVTTNNFKKYLLENSANSISYKKIISKSEFINSLFIDEVYVKTLIVDQLLKTLNLSYNYDLVNRLYELIIYSYFNNTNDFLHTFALDNNLIKIPKIYNEFKVYFCELNNELSSILKHSEVINLKHKHDNEIIVNEFESEVKEIAFAAQNISKLLKNEISINNVYVYSQYNDEKVDLVFNMYGITYNRSNQFYISKSKSIRTLIKELEKEKYSNINEIYKNYSEIKEVVDILNKYVLHENSIKLVTSELKNKKSSFNIKNNIKKCNDLPMLSDQDHLFVLGFNKEEIVPIKKEKLSLNIKQQELYNIDDDNILNQRIKSNFENLLCSKNVVITKNKAKNIENINLNIRVINGKNSFDSFAMNSIFYKKAREKFNKYKLKSEDLNSINNDNMGNVTESTFDIYLKNEDTINLSASKIQQFTKCSYSYYLQHILKLTNSTNKYHTELGTVIHYLLEQSFLNTGDLNLEKDFDNIIKDLKNKNQFEYYKKSIIKHTTKLIEVLDMQDMYSNFKIDKLEEEVKLAIADNVNFNGKVDKILKYNNDYVVVDYKTGDSELKYNNIINKMDIQNFIYLNMLSKVNSNANFVGTFKQQAKYNIKKLSEKSKEINEFKLNGVFLKENVQANLETNKDEIKSIVASKDRKLDAEEFNNQINEIDNIISKCISDIKTNDYSITNIVDKNISLSCKYCGFSDICYKNIYNNKVLKGDVK